MKINLNPGLGQRLLGHQSCRTKLFPHTFELPLFLNMKTVYFTAILVVFSLGTSPAQTSSFSTPEQTNKPAPTPYQIKERGANYRIWQRTNYENTAGGKIVPRVHSYTELA